MGSAAVTRRRRLGWRADFTGGGWRHGVRWVVLGMDLPQGFRRYLFDVDRRRSGAYQA